MATLQSLTVNDTGGLILPTGATATRPSATTTVIQWTNTGSQSYSVLTGTTPTLTNTSWTAPTGVTAIEVLVVAGGGGGSSGGSGGGGAGGLIYNSSYPVTPGTSYTITVGSGGSGGGSSGGRGTSGSNSVFASLTAIGGGAGGSTYSGSNNGDTGGSGGGGGGGSGGATGQGNGGVGTVGQGFAGGNGYCLISTYVFGGGGGGAVQAGNNGYYGGSGGGSGGNGAQFAISGTVTYYAGGGGGGAYVTGSSGAGGLGGGGNGGNYGNAYSGNSGLNGGAGTASTGGGGGGANYASSGGAGGSGIVIIKYTLTSSNTLLTGDIRYNTIHNSFENINTTKYLSTNGLLLNLDAANYVSGTSLTDTVSGIVATWASGVATYSSSNGGTLVMPGTSTVGLIDIGINAYNLGVRRAGTFMGWIQPNNVSSAVYLISDWSSNGMTLRTDSTTSATFYYYSLAMGYTNTGVTTVGQVPTYYTGPQISRVTPTTWPSDNASFSQNTWYFMAGTFDDMNAQMYINGQLVGTASGGDEIGSSPATLKIGNRGDGGGNFISVAQTFANVLVYNRALTATEIATYFNRTRSRFGI